MDITGFHEHFGTNDINVILWSF